MGDDGSRDSVRFSRAQTGHRRGTPFPSASGRLTFRRTKGQHGAFLSPRPIRIEFRIESGFRDSNDNEGQVKFCASSLFSGGFLWRITARVLPAQYRRSVVLDVIFDQF